MNYLPVANFSLSRIIMGSTYFGTTIDRDAMFRLLDLYAELGGNTIDTARVYGAMNGGTVLGASEALIGQWLRSRNPEGFIVITKGGHPPVENFYSPRVRRECVSDDLERSTEALGRVPDIYMLHRDDPATPVGEIVGFMSEFVRDGRARSVACSNWAYPRITAAAEYARDHGLAAFAASEIQWSLAVTTPERYGDDTLICMTPGEYGRYLADGLPVLAYSSQAKGFFAKAAAGGLGALSDKARDRFSSTENIARLRRVIELARRHNCSAGAMALAYITSNPLPAAAIVGCNTEEQLRDSMSAQDVGLTGAEAVYLEQGE